MGIDKQSLNGMRLHKQLPHVGKAYTKLGAKNTAGRVSIAERPPIADLKIDVGHAEADTIFGKNQEFFLLTFVDKCSRFVS